MPARRRPSKAKAKQSDRCLVLIVPPGTVKEIVLEWLDRRWSGSTVEVVSVTPEADGSVAIGFMYDMELKDD